MLTAEELETETGELTIPAEKPLFNLCPSPAITVEVPGSDLTGPALLAWLGDSRDLPGDWPLMKPAHLAAGAVQDQTGETAVRA